MVRHPKAVLQSSELPGLFSMHQHPHASNIIPLTHALRGTSWSSQHLPSVTCFPNLTVLSQKHLAD